VSRAAVCAQQFAQLKAVILATTLFVLVPDGADSLLLALQAQLKLVHCVGRYLVVLKRRDPYATCHLQAKFKPQRR